MGYSFFKIDSLPQQYDVVWCLYPHRESPTVPGPVARPCLVLDVRVETERSIGALVVAYGTGVYDPKHDSVDLIVEERTEYKALGLHKPTRFALALNQRMLLPWCTEYFVPPAYVKGVGIVAGALSAEQIARLIDCLEARGLRPY